MEYPWVWVLPNPSSKTPVKRLQNQIQHIQKKFHKFQYLLLNEGQILLENKVGLLDSLLENRASSGWPSDFQVRL